MLVLVVIGFLVFNFINKSGEVDARTSRSSFIVPASATTPPAENPAATVADTDTTPTTPFVGTMIGAFAELNTVAADSNAVFVYLPGKDGETVHEVPETSMRKAAKTIETNMGVKVGLYTLRPDSPDYGPLAGQMILPGVIAMVKGGGMVPLSGEITASDLMQGFMSAVGTGGCSSGCR